MFVRIKSTPNSPRRSVQIVESYRKGDKVSQKIVRHIGIAMNEKEEQKLRDLANDIIVELEKEKLKNAKQPDLFDGWDEIDIKNKILKKKAGRPKRKNIEDILPASQVTLDNLVEKKRIVEGIHEVAGKMYDDLYGNIFKSKKQNNMLKDLVLARLVNPCSKHKSHKMLSEQFDIHHDLDSIYRLMDKVHDNIDTIKQITFKKTKSLFPNGIDLLLFDVTTLYFESTNTDELRNFDYSKDHPFNTTQFVLALATNTDGLPIGYELFEGSKAEVSTLIASIESWKKLFSIESVCFVGDRAMMSKKNVDLLDANNYQYIIAAKLESFPAHLKAQVLDKNNYQATTLKNDLALIGEFEHNNSRLIVSYKEKRALKDIKDRDAIVTKIQKCYSDDGDTKKIITDKDIKKYTDTTKSATSLNGNEIAADAQWDGLHGVITNITDPSRSPESIIARYAALWRIEESFRINKQNLKMRPMFHFKPERIKAHVAICYMAFSILRSLQYQVNLRQKVSVETILHTLFQVQSSIYIHKITKDLYRMPGAFSHTAQKIYKALDLERSIDASIYTK